MVQLEFRSSNRQGGGYQDVGTFELWITLYQSRNNEGLNMFLEPS